CPRRRQRQEPNGLRRRDGRCPDLHAQPKPERAGLAVREHQYRSDREPEEEGYHYADLLGAGGHKPEAPAGERCKLFPRWRFGLVSRLGRASCPVAPSPPGRDARYATRGIHARIPAHQSLGVRPAGAGTWLQRASVHFTDVHKETPTARLSPTRRSK